MNCLEKSGKRVDGETREKVWGWGGSRGGRALLKKEPGERKKGKKVLPASGSRGGVRMGQK